ncbi:MAG: IMP dehydrogenase, partial [Candidatus Sungbacteria bacterium]|nr:IMP dehydrogenase [Candidatus Sungbacteria bacterium]
MFSRSDEYIDTGSHLGKGIFLKRPIFSANMRTITESRMAIAMARLGGCGVIHQFLSIGKRVTEVERVKRTDSFIVKNPLTISHEATVRTARSIMNDYQISGLIVTDENSGDIVGILSQRDVRWANDDDRVKNRMTALAELIGAPSGISMDEAKKILCEGRIEKLPLLDKEGKKCVGLITASDILKTEKYKFAFRDKKGRLGVAAAVGIGNEMLKEIEKLLKAEADMICIDTARGNSKRMREAVLDARRNFGNEFFLIAGNIDTPEGIEMLYDAGADLPKVGIGGGAACKTREGPGVGLPQHWAIATCAAVARKYKKTFIADGGIKSPADYCKALAAGADAVMIGGIFAGTEETPGQVFYEDGEKWKIFEGSASVEFQMSRTDREMSDDQIRAPEGVARRVKYKGDVSPIVQQLTEFQFSSMSYTGAKNMKE